VVVKLFENPWEAERTCKTYSPELISFIILVLFSEALTEGCENEEIYSFAWRSKGCGTTFL